MYADETGDMMCVLVCSTQYTFTCSLISTCKALMPNAKQSQKFCILINVIKVLDVKMFMQWSSANRCHCYVRMKSCCQSCGDES